KINKFALKFTDRIREYVFGIHSGEALRCLYSIKDPKGCGFSEYCKDCTINNTVLDTFRRKIPYINIESTLYLLPGAGIDRVHLLISTVPLNFDGEDLILISLIDITERKMAEEKLKESEERFKYLVSSSPAIIYTSRFSGDYGATFISDNVQTKWGYSSEDFKNNSDFWLNHVHPDDKEYVLSTLSALFEKEHLMYDYRFKINDGTYHWMHDEVELLKDTEGNPIETIGSVIDITERKIAEQKLRESEEKYRSFLENFQGIAFQGYQDFSAAFFHGNVQEITGFTEDDFISGRITWYSIIHPEDLPIINKKIRKFHDSSSTTDKKEYRIVNKDNNIKWVIEYNQKFYDPVVGKDGVRGVIIDNTKYKTAEHKLKESEKKYKYISNQYEMLLESITDGVYALNRDWEYILINKNAEKLYSMPIEKLIGKKIYDVFPGIEQTPFFKTYKAVMNTGNADRVVNSFTLPDGQMGYYEISVYPIEEGILCLGKDVTEEKVIEQKLIESEEKFRTIAEQSLLGMIIQQDGAIKFANAAVSEIIEYPLQEIDTWTVQDTYNLVYKEDLPFIIEKFKSRQNGDFVSVNQYECRILTKSGNIKWVEIFTKPMLYLGKNAVLSTFIDITVKKQAEEELKEISKLKSELLSRTSHELKTPLVSIKGYADLLLTQHYEELDFYTVSILHEIKQGCSRLESLIKDLLETSKLESKDIELIKTEEDLAFLIRYCVRDLKGLVETRNHELILDIHDELITYFEKERIYEVIINLITNAIKYTPKKGMITIRSEIQNGNYVISVHATGIGLTDEEKTKIFKKFGKIERYGQGLDVVSEGSGLGLYISKKTIELHDGNMWVESDGRKKGSIFYFSLPIIKK
ncbi:MAG: PAS domain S-box protein, partial [Candidatus Thorarchaeota archaeon]